MLNLSLIHNIRNNKTYVKAAFKDKICFVEHQIQMMGIGVINDFLMTAEIAISELLEATASESKGE